MRTRSKRTRRDGHASDHKRSTTRKARRTQQAFLLRSVPLFATLPQHIEGIIFSSSSSLLLLLAPKTRHTRSTPKKLRNIPVTPLSYQPNISLLPRPKPLITAHLSIYEMRSALKDSMALSTLSRSVVSCSALAAFPCRTVSGT